MDANEVDHDRDSVSIFDMMETNGLTSAYSVVSSNFNTHLPPTYTRGLQCVDHIYISRALVPSTASITIQRFGSGFNSDHRPITIQLDMGTMRQDLTRQGYRTINTQRIYQAEDFRSYLAKLFQDHKLKDRLSQIVLAMEEGCTPDLIKQLEIVDKEKSELIAAALKKHSKKTTTTAWSRPLARAGLRVRYWTECLKAQQHRYILTDLWKIKGRELQIDNSKLTKEEMRQHHREALNEYKELKAQAVSLRDRYLEDLANHYAQGNEEKKAQRLRTLRRQEKLRHRYQHITGIFRGDRQPISSLIIPEGDIMRRTTDPEEINTILLDVNKKQLKASSVSPFVSGPLSSIGFDGFTKEAGDILDGDPTTIPSIPQATQTFVVNLARACPTMDIDFTSDEENTKRLHKTIAVTPEKTSSSPSGIHYGIYKVAMQDKDK